MELQSEFRLIAMDQRNAGQSRAPISPVDGWDTYLQDHIALLDHLGIDRVHIMGACIGVSFALRLIQAQPSSVSAAIMQQPIGANAPRTDKSAFERWRNSLTDHPEATEKVLGTFFDNLYSSLFVYSVSRDFVRSCDAPMLILAGHDNSHPFEIAEELGQLAPKAEFIADWRDGAAKDTAFSRVREFLSSHTPVTSG